MSTDTPVTVVPAGDAAKGIDSKKKANPAQSPPRKINLSVEDFAIGINLVIGKGFDTYVRTQQKAGKPIIQRGTKAEWDALLQSWLSAPLRK